MNCLGHSSVTSSRSRAPESRSLVNAVTPWALIRIRLRIASRAGIAALIPDQGSPPPVTMPAEVAADPEREREHVGPLDDQRLGAIGPGPQLSPEDRVGPELPVRPDLADDPAMRPPRDVQAGRLAAVVGGRRRESPGRRCRAAAGRRRRWRRGPRRGPRRRGRRSPRRRPPARTAGLDLGLLDLVRAARRPRPPRPRAARGARSAGVPVPELDRSRPARSGPPTASR